MKADTMIKRALGYTNQIHAELQKISATDIVEKEHTPLRQMDKSNCRYLLNGIIPQYTKEYIRKEIESWRDSVEETHEIILRRQQSTGGIEVRVSITIFPAESYFDIDVTCYQEIATKCKSFKVRKVDKGQKAIEVRLEGERWVKV
jgi:hypothetical protein